MAVRGPESHAGESEKPQTNKNEKQVHSRSKSESTTEKESSSRIKPPGGGTMQGSRSQPGPGVVAEEESSREAGSSGGLQNPSADCGGGCQDRKGPV